MRTTSAVWWLALSLASASAQAPACRAAEERSLSSSSASLRHLSEVMDRDHVAFGVYEDVSSAGNHFHQYGAIGDDPSSASVNGSFEGDRHAGATSIRAVLNDTGNNFAGFYLMNGLLHPGETTPSPNWGDEPCAGVDVSGARRLSFWAKGSTGKERVEFFFGGVGRKPNAPGNPPASAYPDSAKVKKRSFKLKPHWRQYSLRVGRRDMSAVLGGFGWIASAKRNEGGVTFLIDDIGFELSAKARARRLAEPRFLRSFATGPYQRKGPAGDFDLALRNTAFSYDNALALLGFLADGSPESLARARLIGDAFVYAQQHDRTYEDGRVRDAYASGDLALPPGWRPNGKVGTVPVPGFWDEEAGQFVEVLQEGLSTGNEAWVLIAFLALHRATGEAAYWDAAERLAAVIVPFRDDVGPYGGFRGGLDNPEGPAPAVRAWASTEHNIDLYAAFKTMHEISGDPVWAEHAAHARAFVGAMFDESTGCLLTGTRDPSTRNEVPGQLPVDVQAWAVLAIDGILNELPSLLACAEAHHRTTAGGLSGFDFNDDKDGVWFEGTAHMGVAYAEAGDDPAAEEIRGTLRAAQAGEFGDGQGIMAATEEGLTSGFGFEYFRRLHVATAAWNVFAQLGWNPYYQRFAPVGRVSTASSDRPGAVHAGVSTPDGGARSGEDRGLERRANCASTGRDHRGASCREGQARCRSAIAILRRCSATLERPGRGLASSYLCDRRTHFASLVGRSGRTLWTEAQPRAATSLRRIPRSRGSEAVVATVTPVCRSAQSPVRWSRQAPRHRLGAPGRS